MKIILNKGPFLLTRWDYKTWECKVFVTKGCGRLCIHAGRYTATVNLWRW